MGLMSNKELVDKDSLQDTYLDNLSLYVDNPDSGVQVLGDAEI